MDNERDDTYNLLLLFKLYDLLVQLLKSILQISLVFQYRYFIFLLHSKFHFAHLQRLLKFVTLRLQVLPPLLLLSPCLITLIKVTSQVLGFLLLLPENLSKFVSSMSHVLQHVSKFIHWFWGLIEHVPSCTIIQIELINLLLVRIDLSLSPFNLLLHILCFKFRCTALLIHDVHCLLLVADLTVDVLELAAKPLRHLRLCCHSLLELLVLHHLLRGGTT